MVVVARPAGLAFVVVAALSAGCHAADAEPLLEPDVVRPAPTPTLAEAPDPPSPAPPAAAPVHLLFVGDVAMIGPISWMRRDLRIGPVAGVDGHYPFTRVHDRIAAADLAIANLECVLTRTEEPRPGGLHGFPEATDALAGAGFDLLDVANNHTFDAGLAGFHEMLDYLGEARLAAVGTESMEQRPDHAVVRKVDGQSIGFLGYQNRGKQLILDDVKRARAEVDVLVVLMHWGEERNPNPTAIQRSLGRAVLDAGADLVVGAHAHVLQPVEEQDGKLIAYGLGDFVFPIMTGEERTRLGGALVVDVADKRIVGHQLLRSRLDDAGLPYWLDE